MGRLDGRVALETGAGRGFGRAIALAFGREGAEVAVKRIDELPVRHLGEVEDLAGWRGVSRGPGSQLPHRPVAPA